MCRHSFSRDLSFFIYKNTEFINHYFVNVGKPRRLEFINQVSLGWQQYSVGMQDVSAGRLHNKAPENVLFEWQIFVVLV